MNTTQPPPPGATSATEWDCDGVRLPGGTKRGEQVHVDIYGIQRAFAACSGWATCMATCMGRS